MAADQCDLLCLDLPRAEALRRRRMSAAAAEHGAGVAKSLADPTRFTLATVLRDGGEVCGCDLAWITEQSQNLVSHHLKVLRTAGLVRSRRDGKIVFHELTDLGVALLDSTLAGDAVGA